MSSTRKTPEHIVPACSLLPDVAAAAVQCTEAAAAAPCTEAAAAAQWEAAEGDAVEDAEEDAVEAVVSGLQVSASARPRRLDTSTIAIGSVFVDAGEIRRRGLRQSVCGDACCIQIDTASSSGGL
jgi:hypothetical protein